MKLQHLLQLTFKIYSLLILLLRNVKANFLLVKIANDNGNSLVDKNILPLRPQVLQTPYFAEDMRNDGLNHENPLELDPVRILAQTGSKPVLRRTKLTGKFRTLKRGIRCSLLHRTTMQAFRHLEIANLVSSEYDIFKEIKFQRGAFTMQLFMLWSPNFEEARYERGVT